MKELELVTLVSVTYQSERVARPLAELFARFPQSLIVDNASSDATIEIMRKASPRTRIVALNRNFGYGYGNNRGVDAVSTPFALLINPDCHIEPDAVRALVRCAIEFPRAVGVAPHTFRPNGQREIPYRSGYLAPASRGVPLPIAEGPVSARAIAGSCMLVNIENFKRVGMYDENLFMYYEEDDLGQRATQSGFDMISTPTATAIHVGNASSPASVRIRFIKNFHVTRSKLVMTGKYRGRLAAQLLRLRLLAVGPLAIAGSAIALRPAAVVKWIARMCAALATSSNAGVLHGRR